MSGLPGFVSKYLDIPVVEQGFDSAGVHCWGLVWLMYNDVLGIKLSKYQEFTASDLRAAARAFIKDAFIPPWHEIKDFGYKDMDVVLMRSEVRTDGRMHSIASHVGVFLQGYVVHAEYGFGVSCVPVGDRIVKYRILQGFRHEAVS